ncbi:Endoribonuclease YbeY [Candidatus Jidaibacter acanthamoeba]|uniref:Endoribonuclease YbeY n=1 Tax=Candidatus Jidaibacter acanthamoebae TaxID=86105 RepID=A0A0C1QJD2_9RICK|nr:rRNA maturation RNase YbeY [Candidatus Jidaibacter acanthamoeba]KIE04303.1 Endoribonuclease YbeY [Candidatus Jidaibacter acanthamoeba]
MSKAEEEPNSINFSNIEVELINDSSLWNTLDCEPEDFIKQVITHTLIELKLTEASKKIEVSVLLADDEKLQELNRQYRDKDKPTNVLSFPNYDLKPGNYLKILKKVKEIYLGDIALSYTTIYHESIEQDKLFMHHLAHMLVHSILHLIGYDHEDESEAEEMEELEIKILTKLNISNPY